MNILQKLKNKLYSKEVKKNNKAMSITELPGLTIICTAKELFHLPREIKDSAHNIYMRDMNALIVAKSIPTTYSAHDKFYLDTKGYVRVPQKDGEHRKNDKYAIFG